MSAGRQAIIERERRFATPAGLAAIAAAALVISSLFVQGGALQGDTAAEQFRSLDADSGTYILSGAMRAAGFLLMIVPLVYLFRAASARSNAVRGALVGFCVLGPALFAAQSVVDTVGLADAASDFVVREAEAPELTVAELRRQARDEPQSISEVTFYPGADAADVELDDEAVATVEVPEDQRERLEGALGDAGVSTDTDEDGDPGDALVDNAIEDSGLFSAGRNLLFPALLGLIVAVFYTSLQAMRVGLLSRFMGTFGMALSVSVLILGLLVGFMGISLYVAAIGLIILDRWPRGRPPAWDAGAARPWPKPGQEPEPAESPPLTDSIEGEAAEVEAQGENPNVARRERARKRKRKRRR